MPRTVECRHMRSSSYSSYGDESSPSAQFRSGVALALDRRLGTGDKYVSLCSKSLLYCAYQIHDNAFVNCISLLARAHKLGAQDSTFLPQMSSEDLDQTDLQRWYFTMPRSWLRFLHHRVENLTNMKIPVRSNCTWKPT